MFDSKDGIEFIEITISAILGGIAGAFRSGRKVGEFETRLVVVEEDTVQIRKEQRELKKTVEEIDCIDAEECRDRQKALNQLIQAQLDAGTREFDEIKRLIRDSNTQSENRHNMLVTELLKGGKK